MLLPDTGHGKGFPAMTCGDFQVALVLRPDGLIVYHSHLNAAGSAAFLETAAQQVKWGLLGGPGVYGRRPR